MEVESTNETIRNELRENIESDFVDGFNKKIDKENSRMSFINGLMEVVEKIVL